MLYIYDNCTSKKINLINLNVNNDKKTILFCDYWVIYMFFGNNCRSMEQYLN